MSDKVYTPEVIQENPFPNEADIFPTPPKSDPANTYSPKTTTDKPFKKKVIAQETIAQSLNTKSRKILGQYEFTQQGAIKVGDYQEGISGEVKISPDGIIAKDKAGLTTFALDGDTGSATFKGTVQAQDFTVIDELGLVSLSNFSQSESNDQALGQTITSTSQTDITGASLTIELQRSSLVLLLYSIQGYLNEGGGNLGDAEIFPNVNEEVPIATKMHLILLSGNNTGRTYTGFHVAELPAGTNTVKLQAKISNVISGTPGVHVLRYKMSYVVLGS